jgi:predicted deacylase
VMRYLKMMDGAPSMVEAPVWIERVAGLTSDVTGIFYPVVTRGAYVQKGMKVGYITDYLGKTLVEAKAPESGVVLFIRAVPSMTKGETIANIGVPVR